MYLGNNVKAASSKLLYSLFKSNWMEQSKTCKSNIAILGEVLKRDKVIMVAKLYPLTLTTFTSVSVDSGNIFLCFVEIDKILNSFVWPDYAGRLQHVQHFESYQQMTDKLAHEH